jgi:8-oxo-dGTP diphosphatase
MEHHVEASKYLRVAAAVAWRDDALLLTQRPPGGALGLLWEFPGGKIEVGESPEAAVIRELREELGVEAIVHETMHVHTHRYPHGLEVEIHFVRCSLASVDFAPSAEVHAVRWVRPAEVALGEVLAADREFLVSLGAKQ